MFLRGLRTSKKTFCVSRAGTRKHVDLIISGGSVVGSTFANLLRNDPITEDLKFVILECNKNDFSFKKDSPPDIRSYAINPLSQKIFEKANVWHNFVRKTPYDTMELYDSWKKGRVSFKAGDRIYSKLEHLGHIIEHRVIMNSLSEPLRSDFVHSNKFQISRGNGDRLIRVKTLCGKEFSAPLIVGADGSNSAVRKHFGLRMNSREYGQKTVACIVKLENATNSTFQRFLPLGTLGLLPLHENYGCIVWSTHCVNAERLLCLEEEEFVREVNEFFRGDYEFVVAREKKIAEVFSETPETVRIAKEAVYSATKAFLESVPGLKSVFRQVEECAEVLFPSPKEGDGLPPVVASLEGKRVAFPLSCGHVDKYVGERVALIGDSAHVVNPMAGQGLNMGIRDALHLKEALRCALLSGADIGALHHLENYQSKVFFENQAKVSGIDLFSKFFMINNEEIVVARNAAMGVLNNTPFLKRVMLKNASYSVFS